MAYSRTFENIWKILKENSFKIVNESDNDILCLICKKIMINSHNGPCGCRYCLECIRKHLSEINHCPGITELCHEQITIDSLQIDNAINVKISKTIVNCPFASCHYKTELKMIGDHICLCNCREINCPFSEIGCKQVNLTSENMSNHFQLEIVSHSTLILEYFANIKNEMELQSKSLNEIKEENKSMNEKILQLEQVNEMLQLSNNELQARSVHFTGDLVEIRNNFKSVENDNVEVKKIIDKICTDNIGLKCRVDSQDETMKDVIDVKLPGLTTKITEIETMLGEREIYGRCEWILEYFSKLEKNTKILSKPFYSDKRGYKMCISVEIGDFLYMVGLCIIRGDFDHELPWPFRHAFAVHLVNQYDGIIQDTVAIKYNDLPNHKGWNRPVTETNDPIYGKWTMISPKIVKNDRMMFKCQIHLNK